MARRLYIRGTGRENDPDFDAPAPPRPGLKRASPMAHQHHDHRHHRDDHAAGDRRMVLAVVVNVGLTVVQIVAGIVSGSLALIADAIHNLSDAVALGLAYGARRIARRPTDETMTFGYVRAESIAALVNYTTLVVIGVYLIYEALGRFAEPRAIDGWIVVIVAGVALIIDVATAALTYRMAKTSANIRAAFLHNLADALSSVGVIVAGTLILLFDWRIVDALVTLAIAGTILWHVGKEIGGVVRVLMLGAPPGIAPQAVIAALRQIRGVDGVHHAHLWQLDEHRNSLEAHLVVDASSMARSAEIRQEAKAVLAARFAIGHSTLELECEGDGCADAAVIGHPDAVPADAGEPTH